MNNNRGKVLQVANFGLISNQGVFCKSFQTKIKENQKKKKRKRRKRRKGPGADFSPHRRMAHGPFPSPSANRYPFSLSVTDNWTPLVIPPKQTGSNTVHPRA
jgi:hypothetical protein